MTATIVLKTGKTSCNWGGTIYDFQLALDGNAQAKNFFETLDRRNRYAVLFRIQTAKTAETRERKILQFVQMLERHEKIHE